MSTNMNDIIVSINNLSYSNRYAKGYYGQKLQEMHQQRRSNILDLMYNKLCKQNGPRLDLHGVNREFLDQYLLEFIIYKLENYENILVVTGRGSGIVNRKSKKILLDNKYIIKEIDLASFYVSY